ncbi:MAG: alpha/beta hydrolase [Lachnospiraceae bacterium]|nr:alpha/beta hydrolase [Lachnospiraceae bacterium]
MKKKILIGTGLTVLVLTAGIFIYLLTGNYSADESCKEYLQSTDTVDVSKVNEGYFFDGPGEDIAIIFYPGAKVEYTAYARLMFKIAENGKDCFLIKMPFNMAFFGMNKADDIIDNYEYDNYYIAGHSLGGAVACYYGINNPDNVKGIITLAAYSTKKIPSDMEYLFVHGSEDKVLNMDRYEKNKKNLPENSTEHIIEGGNHAGFANYGSQKGDGKLNITNEEMQDLTVKYITEQE